MRKHGFHAVVAQREAVRGAPGQRVEQERWRDARAAAQRHRLGERVHGLEQHHVVEDLHRLATANVSTMRDVGAEAAQERLDAVEDAGQSAHRDAQGSLLRCLTRARDGGIGVVNAALRKAPRQLARQSDAGSAEVHER
jgi:hypothetical protein